MRDVEADAFHAFDDRRRRRGRGDEAMHAMIDAAFPFVGRVDQHCVTIGAPQWCVTFSSRIASRIVAVTSTFRRHTSCHRSRPSSGNQPLQ
jgi:hypothetical protein